MFYLPVHLSEPHLQQSRPSPGGLECPDVLDCPDALREDVTGSLNRNFSTHGPWGRGWEM